MRATSAWKVGVVALAAMSLWACWSFDADRDTYCARPGAFCFDGGVISESDAGVDAGFDAGVDAGPEVEPDAGVMDAGMDAGPEPFVLDAVALGSAIRDEWVNGIAVLPNGAVRMAIATAGGSTALQYGSDVGDPEDGVVGEVTHSGAYSPYLDLVGSGDQVIRALAVQGNTTLAAGSLGPGGVFESQAGKASLLSAAGGTDGFLARLDVTGLQSAHTISFDAHNTDVLALSASPGLVVLAGRQVSGVLSDAFIQIEVGTSGEVSTATQCTSGSGDAPGASFEAVSLIADGGYVVAGGSSNGTCDLDGQSISSSYPRALLAWFSIQGGTLLGTPLRLASGDGSASAFTSIAPVPGTQTVFAAGRFEGALNIVGGPYTALGSRDGFVLATSIGAAGSMEITPLASLHLASSGKITALHLAATDDALYVAGGFSGQLQIADKTFGEAADTNAWGFVARLDHSLEVSWVRTWGGVSMTDLTPAGVVIDSQGKVVVAGNFAEPFEVDGKSLTNMAQPNYQSQIYVLWMAP